MVDRRNEDKEANFRLGDLTDITATRFVGLGPWKGVLVYSLLCGAEREFVVA